MSRIGLGRHGQLDAEAGDPLDGVVNLFDVGLVLAVAFLVAGLGLSKTDLTKKQDPSGQEKALTQPSTPSKATGRGKPVGQVYQLDDGSLVLVDPNGKQTTP
ncbi:DUF2149 domain-containing protein [Patulibacter sp. NPDC049589]|uniref:DUF2149 domain-containing protein n=1 Tax=Patulibacter sp. NPDC049589 TaxID=3154731 RepID=UPI003435614C